MKALETNYNGILFRSRLEARWAIYFKLLEIEYVYEPECFVLSYGLKYTPDFYLPKYDLYVEIKPTLKWMEDNYHIGRYNKFEKELLVLSSSFPDINKSSYLNKYTTNVVFCPYGKYKPFFATGEELGETEPLFKDRWIIQLEIVKKHRFWN